MRFSRAFIPTLRETPAEAQALSHQLMLRAGLIRQLAAGVYSFLPLGWRVMQKVMRIIREEMDAIRSEEHTSELQSQR
jgi:prolyl-tRNA synthetase